jgi:hypothetical protein
VEWIPPNLTRMAYVSITRDASLSTPEVSKQLLALNDPDVKECPHCLLRPSRVRTIKLRDSALAAMVYLAQEAPAYAVVFRSVLSECRDESSELRAAMLSAAAGDDKRRGPQFWKTTAAPTTAQRAAAMPNTETPSDRPRAKRRRVSARCDGLSGSFAVVARPPPPSTPPSTFPPKEAASRSRAGLGGCTALTGLPPRVLMPGYNKSYSGTRSVVGCRYGSPGDQLHSDTIAATPCRAPGCTKMTHRLCGLRFAPNGADEPTGAAPSALAAPYCHKNIQHRKFLFQMLYNNQAPR